MRATAADRARVAIVKKAVAGVFKVSVADIDSPSRRRSLTQPRWVAMLIVRKRLGLSARQIARTFNRKDHKTVTHALACIIDLSAQNPAIALGISIATARTEARLRQLPR